MWIVRLALRRPYTFAVFALLILILGVFSIETMPTDIFPNIDIPVVTVVWNFNGLSADQMANRIISNSERGITTTVSDVEHIESQSLNGIGIIKIFFQPSVNIGSAVAQVTSISQVQLRSLPPGSVPPFIIQYNASSVPVLQLGMAGEGLNEQQVFDLGTNTIRTQLATIEGAQTPFPYGGKQRQIQVDLDLAALQAKGLAIGWIVGVGDGRQRDPQVFHRAGNGDGPSGGGIPIASFVACRPERQQGQEARECARAPTG